VPVSTTTRFAEMLQRVGSDIVYHREEGGEACPCLSPEGFRDPTWHLAHPEEPVCNEQGYLTTATEFTFKGSIQPALTRYERGSQRANNLLGEVQRDDRIGIFPAEWGGNQLDFSDWSEAGEDYLLYDGLRYTVVTCDWLPDVDGSPRHHAEVGLRLLSAERPS
jgi:hypothetical protein